MNKLLILRLQELTTAVNNLANALEFTTPTTPEATTPAPKRDKRDVPSTITGANNPNKKCIYPMCNCPIELGPNSNCVRGYDR